MFSPTETAAWVPGRYRLDLEWDSSPVQREGVWRGKLVAERFYFEMSAAATVYQECARADAASAYYFSTRQIDMAIEEALLIISLDKQYKNWKALVRLAQLESTRGRDADALGYYDEFLSHHAKEPELESEYVRSIRASADFLRKRLDAKSEKDPTAEGAG